MDLEKIVEVCDVIGSDAANIRLKEGWILLETNLVEYKIPVSKYDAERDYGAKGEVVYHKSVDRRYLLGKTRE